MLDFARTVLETEARAILDLIDRLDENFTRAVDTLLACHGRVIVTGMGKSGIIGKKIAATLTSTGTPAMFMHPADAVHGDLGMIVAGDVILALSYSGETPEINNLLTSLQRLGVPIISIVGNITSFLARSSHIVLNVSVDHEACPLGLAPSASTTATLAMGDALALVLLKKRGFNQDDFARIHPGGKLGKKLMKVRDLMVGGGSLPVVREETLMKDVIYEISSKGLGATTVVDAHGRLSGIVTDGDLRRAIERDTDMLKKTASTFMSRAPKVIHPDEFAIRGVRMMESFTITALVVTDEDQQPVGILKLQDIIKEGVI